MPPLRVRVTIASSLSLEIKSSTLIPATVAYRTKRDNVVTVAAEHHRVHVAHADAEFHGQETAEAGAVEDAGHAHDFVFGETELTPAR